MISFRALTTVSLLGLLVTLAGCSAESATGSGAGTTDTANQASVAADSTTAPTGQNRAALHGPHGGPDMLLFAALKEPSLSLTDAQKATIQGAIDANRPSAPPAFDKSKVTALAAGIRAGKVDATSIQMPAHPDMAAHQAQSAKALTTLHDTLTADQRKALVAAVQAKMADGPKEGHEHMGRGPKDGMGRGEGGPLGHLTEGLDLTQAQQDSIKTKLEALRPAAPTDAQKADFKAQHEAMKTAMQTKLTSFAADSFDANAFVTPPAGAKPPQMMGNHADHFAQELSVITSVLEPAQREKLAQKIEAGPQFNRPVAPSAPVQQQ